MTGQRIMVIDDELSMREVLTILLQRDGYEVQSFATSDLARIHRRRALGKSPMGRRPPSDLGTSTISTSPG